MKPLLHTKRAWDKMAISAVSRTLWKHAMPPGEPEQGEPTPRSFHASPFPTCSPWLTPNIPSLHLLLFIERPVIQFWLPGGRRGHGRIATKVCAWLFLQPPWGPARGALPAHKTIFQRKPPPQVKARAVTAQTPANVLVGVCFSGLQARLSSCQVTKFFLLRTDWKTWTCGDHGGAYTLIKREGHLGRPIHVTDQKGSSVDGSIIDSPSCLLGVRRFHCASSHWVPQPGFTCHPLSV